MTLLGYFLHGYCLVLLILLKKRLNLGICFLKSFTVDTQNDDLPQNSFPFRQEIIIFFQPFSKSGLTTFVDVWNYQNKTCQDFITTYIKYDVMHYKLRGVSVRAMMFSATFNKISAISWRSLLLVEETGVPGENHRPVSSH